MPPCSSLVNSIKEICAFPSESESERIISGFRWIGLFSSEICQVRNGNLLDTLCGRLEGLMKYEQGERDLVMLQHKFIVEWADGSVVCDYFLCLGRKITQCHLYKLANAHLNSGSVWLPVGPFCYGFDCWIALWNCHTACPRRCADRAGSTCPVRREDLCSTSGGVGKRGCRHG
jgi:hypothetical protein